MQSGNQYKGPGEASRQELYFTQELQIRTTKLNKKRECTEK